MPSGTGDFLRLLAWELGTHKLAEIFAYGKWLWVATTRGVRSGPKVSETCNSEDFLTFPLLRTWVNINIG